MLPKIANLVQSDVTIKRNPLNECPNVHAHISMDKTPIFSFYYEIFTQILGLTFRLYFRYLPTQLFQCGLKNLKLKAGKIGKWSLL